MDIINQEMDGNEKIYDLLDLPHECQNMLATELIEYLSNINNRTKYQEKYLHDLILFKKLDEEFEENNKYRFLKMNKPYRPMWYDFDGKAISKFNATHSPKFNNFSNRIVKQDKINGFFISTVYIGLDLNLAGTIPKIYETMIFDQRNSEQELTCNWTSRHETREEALSAHEFLCLSATKGFDFNTET